MKVDFVARILRDEHAVMHGVRRAGRNQSNIDDRARGPCIALVDGIAVRIDLQRTIEVGAFFDGTLATVFDHARPENGLASVVGAFEFQPGIVGIDRAAGKEVADFLGAYDDVHANRIAPAQRRLHFIEWG
jgi:hypothetical protein